MKACPRCRSEVGWFFASMTTAKRNLGVPNGKRVNYFIFAPGCGHARGFTANVAPVPVSEHERPDIEAKWDARAELMFDEYTSAWTDAQRSAYRAELWPPPVAVVPAELFDRNREESPVVAYAAGEEQHPFSP